MNIQENIEQAKKYIANNKLDEALNLLYKSPTSDLNIQDEIFFEIGKVFLLKRKYNKSVFYLKKIKKMSLKQFVYDLLVQDYNELKEYNKILNIFRKFDKENINDYILYLVLKSSYKLKKLSKMFSIINIIRANNIYNTLLEELINNIYKNLSIKIQKLNRKNKKKEVKSLFKSIYKYIPNNDIKFKNIILNEYEIAISKKSLKSYPRFAQVVITTNCNLNCVMCDKNNHDAKYELSNKILCDLIKIMPYLQKLVLRGGEVFLYKNFNNILDEAQKNNVVIEILTNGLLLNENNIKKLIKSNAILVFSIDSPMKTTYEYIRKGASFEKLIKNILLLNKIKKELKSEIKFNINMVVMKMNYKQIPDMIKFARKYDFNGLTLNPINGEYIENCFSYKVDNRIIKELSEKRGEYEIMAKNNNIILINKLPNKTVFKFNSDTCFDNNYCENNSSRKFCHVPWREIFLDTGFIFKPGCLCEQQIEGADLEKDNNIIYLWNSHFMKNYRKNIIAHNEKEICSKRCLLNKFMNYDNYRIID